MVDITTTIIHVTYVLHISVRPSFINNIANKRRSANKVNTQKCTCHVVSFYKGIQNTSSSTIFTWLKDRGFPISPSSYDLFDFIWIFLSSLTKYLFALRKSLFHRQFLHWCKDLLLQNGFQITHLWFAVDISTSKRFTDVSYNERKQEMDWIVWPWSLSDYHQRIIQEN